jgi:hypothetical protein
MVGDSSPQTYTDPLHKESVQLNSQGVSFSESTHFRSEYMYIVMFKDGGTANPSPDISDVDVGSTAATELSGPARFLIFEHDSKTSSTIYWREACISELFLWIQMPRELIQVWKWQRNTAALDRDNESAGNCTECEESDETGAVGPAIVLPSDSAANLTAQDSTIRSGIATPVTRNEHNSVSLHNTVGSVTLPSRNRTPSFMPVGGKYSAEKLNLQSQNSNPTLTCKVLNAPCLTVLLVSVVVILSCTLCLIRIREDLILMP